MKKTMRYIPLLLVVFTGLQMMAAVPSGYYDNAKNKSDRALMSALHKIISGHTKRSYDQLWSDFRTTDCNGNTIIDRYSNTQYIYSTNQCGTYSGVGDCYNREHSIPNSWWGGSSSDTAYTDLQHMFPVDGFVNSKRGNHPFGDCNNGTVYGTGKLGACTFTGYSGTVFEVADEYKGDFARVYFYFATRYMTRMSSYTSGTGSAVFTSSSYLGLTNWAINQLLEWHRNDPVSTLETTRNDAVYGIQRNRNPFIDNPDLVEYIWGNKQGNVWTGSGSGTTTPTLTAPTNGSTVYVGTNTGNGVTRTITVKGSNLTKALTVSVTGNGFSVTPSSITAANANNGTSVTVTYNGTNSSATGTLTISSSEVSSTVNLTASYSTGGGGEAGEEAIETWEGCTGYGSYATTFIQGHAFRWYTSDVGIWSGDPNCNGSLSCRFGKSAASYIEMAEDFAGGATKVSFYAAKWSNNESNPTLQVYYSTDAGASWVMLGSCAPTTTWQQYNFTLNVTGNVRIKVLQIAGARLNIDDITITGNAVTPTPVISITPLASMEAELNGSSNIVSGTVTAEDNTENITLTVEGNFQISLNRYNWAKTLTLDPTGEVFYVRIADTSVAGEYDGTISATTSLASAFADIEGRVNAPSVLLGDVNKDGSVNISDVTRLIDYVLGGQEDQFDRLAADMNQDNAINISDVTSLIDYVLGSSSTANAMNWVAVPALDAIAIENPCGVSLWIYNLDGECVATNSTHGNSVIQLPQGIYVVASETTSIKVVVK